MLSAIVLAAGESRRTCPYIKALLPIERSTFLERIVGLLFDARVDEVVVVLGARHVEILERVLLGRAAVMINEDWERGQLSSLRLGVSRLSPASEGALVTLVDHPLVRRSTYEILIAAWRERPDRIVVPTHAGANGHPALFPRRLYGPLLRDELPRGARDLLAREEGNLVRVPVDDPGTVQDIDTPEDYRRMIGELP
jgi:molybdenum cofactor cytidylyltransferase